VRRRFWVSHMLPKLTQDFLDKVVAKPYVRFQLDGLDEPNSAPPHIAVFQSFAPICVPLKLVIARHMPWQFRFILGKSARSFLCSSLTTDNALRKDVFDKAGWEFWITESGFCLAPKAMVDELAELHIVYTTWIKTRDEFEFSPLDKALMDAEEKELATSVLSPVAGEAPEPPLLVRQGSNAAAS